MFKIKKPEKIDINNLNDVIKIAKLLLKIIVILVFVLLISNIISIGISTGIFKLILSFIKLCIPLFIGFIIAWLFNPLVCLLEDKKVPRVIGTIISYLIFIGLIFLVFYFVLPMLSGQINELAKTLPANFEIVNEWINNLFVSLSDSFNYNFDEVKNGLLAQGNSLLLSITDGLPTLIINVVTAFTSGIINFIIGLIIGFYFLLGFPSFHKNIVAFVPKDIRNSTEDLIKRIDSALRSFVTGTLLVTVLVFIASSIGFTIVGLEAPLLFGLFCGLTNIIPYVGPYIGGAPAVIVGLTIDVRIGLLVLVVVVIIQFIEGNVIQPLVMSRVMKLHPVTIVMGLLIMGYFFGIVGMIFATPLISFIKIIYTFTNEKIDIRKKILRKEELSENNS